MKKVRPDFLICGAAKSGTTALYEVMREHENICMSVPKEPNFFRHNFEKGEDWYSECFSHYDGERLIGEASVSNMVDSKITTKRIGEFYENKKPKIIFILRDPVERVYSDYFDSVKTGKIRHTNGKFGDFIRGKVRKPDPHTNAYHYERVLKRSEYSDQIQNYIESFGIQNLHIIISSDFGKNTEKEANNVLNFLGGVKEFEGLKVVKSNQGSYPNEIYKKTLYLRKVLHNLIPKKIKKKVTGFRRRVKKLLLTGEKPKMSSRDRRFLFNKYEEDIKFVERLLGRDLDEWRKRSHD